MIHAYDKIYLVQARESLGLMLDFVVYDLEQDLSTFWEVFINSDICKKFEKGSSRVVAGMSGVEMAYEVLGDKYWEIERKPVMNRSAEYWLGWALAYYQWQSGKSFKAIDDCIKIDKLYGMYATLHEADISLFVEIIDDKFKEYRDECRLKRLRMYAGLSQRALAEKAGVPLRQIQLFEQGRRDINKTQGATLYQLSNALGCSMERLLSK